MAFRWKPPPPAMIPPLKIHIQLKLTLKTHLNHLHPLLIPKIPEANILESLNLPPPNLNESPFHSLLEHQGL